MHCPVLWNIDSCDYKLGACNFESHEMKNWQSRFLVPGLYIGQTSDALCTQGTAPIVPSFIMVHRMAYI